jgi:SNF2 family DNA or RNA helicase
VHVFEHEGSTKAIAADNVLTKLLRLQQITSGYISEVIEDAAGRKTSRSYTIGESPKLEPLRELIGEMGADEKVIIWVRFRHDAERVCEGLTLMKAGKAGMVISGDDAGNKAILKAFQDTDEYRFLVATPGTCAFGLDLFGARYAVRFSASFKLDDALQAEARVHRQGQTRQVTYIDLVVKDTVDELVLTALQDKGDLLDYVMAQGNEIMRYLPEIK